MVLISVLGNVFFPCSFYTQIIFTHISTLFMCRLNFKLIYSFTLTTNLQANKNIYIYITIIKWLVTLIAACIFKYAETYFGLINIYVSYKSWHNRNSRQLTYSTLTLCHPASKKECIIKHQYVGQQIEKLQKPKPHLFQNQMKPKFQIMSKSLLKKI